MNRNVAHDLRRHECGSINGVRERCKDLGWASERVSMLQEMVKNKGLVIYMKQMADTICNLARPSECAINRGKVWGNIPG